MPAHTLKNISYFFAFPKGALSKPSPDLSWKPKMFFKPLKLAEPKRLTRLVQDVLGDLRVIHSATSTLPYRLECIIRLKYTHWGRI